MNIACENVYKCLCAMCKKNHSDETLFHINILYILYSIHVLYDHNVVVCNTAQFMVDSKYKFRQY